VYSWRGHLEIGDKLRLPVRMCVKTKHEAPPRMQLVAADDAQSKKIERKSVSVRDRPNPIGCCLGLFIHPIQDKLTALLHPVRTEIHQIDQIEI
jgi:hypothetical protein